MEHLQKEAEEMEHVQRKGEGIATRDPSWRIKRFADLAAKAKRARVEREFLESLIRSAGPNPPPDLPWRSTRLSILTGTWTAVALSILEQNVAGKEKEFIVPSGRRNAYGPRAAGDLPAGVRGVLMSIGRGGDEFGTALAAIDSYADDRARDFLLVYALDTFEDKYGQPSPLTASALRFLSCYDPKPINAKIAAAYQAAVSGRSLDVKSPRYPRSRVGCLRSCLTQLEFAESLEPGPRKRFERMLRLLECTCALSPQGTTVGARANPAVLYPSWQDGDERFLPHLLATGRMPAHIILAKAPISPKGWDWLNHEAESGDWPAHVKADLTRILREREGVKEPRENRIPRIPGIPGTGIPRTHN